MTTMNPFFRESDLDEVYYQYFEGIWETSEVYADPSGWKDTLSQAASMLPRIVFENYSIDRYYLDEGNNLGNLKERVVALFSAWENMPLTQNRMTLYNSVSTASAAILVALKRRGIERVMFETPAYSVTINQARLIGLDVDLLPTYKEDNFALQVSDNKLLHKRSPCAIWLTQPRMSLGFDQPLSMINSLASELKECDFIVVDEATEQRFPSHLHPVLRADMKCSIVRVRGVLKGAGLNAIRLAVVLHDAGFRKDLEGAQEVLGASLDLWSLAIAASLGDEPDRLRDILEVANRQACSLRKTAMRLALGFDMEPSHLVNGYMGSLLIDLRYTRQSYGAKKAELLKFLKGRKIPVILGASMHFALDPPWEQIRLNYFNREHHIVRLLEELSIFVRTVRE